MHIINDVYKNCNRRNKIAHAPISVQKFDVFMDFENYTLQMMKEMMLFKKEIMKNANYTLQTKIKGCFTRTSSIVI